MYLCMYALSLVSIIDRKIWTHGSGLRSSNSNFVVTHLPRRHGARVIADKLTDDGGMVHEIGMSGALR